jgi:sulfate adenylyltransferase (ADP) / ATP adenylyltransferase
MAFLDPVQIWPRTLQATRRALASGALQPIATALEHHDQDGVKFQLRVLGHIEHKEQARRDGPDNPFADPEPALVVGELSDTHLAVLNKFNVVDHHLLVITRVFEDQQTPLTQADFEALWICLAGIDGLGFYNAGTIAGASQRHKHLQLVPALGPEHHRAPIASLVSRALPDRGVGSSKRLPFAHALCRVGLPPATPPAHAAGRLTDAYRALGDAVALAAGAPYNLLCTRDWMLLVPRARADYEGINLNALAFAGSLLVRTPEQAALLRRVGPMAALAATVAAA